MNANRWWTGTTGRKVLHAFTDRSLTRTVCGRWVGDRAVVGTLSEIFGEGMPWEQEHRQECGNCRSSIENMASLGEDLAARDVRLRVLRERNAALGARFQEELRVARGDPRRMGRRSAPL
jgi:hypothetical protein